MRRAAKCCLVLAWWLIRRTRPAYRRCSWPFLQATHARFQEFRHWRTFERIDKDLDHWGIEVNAVAVTLSSGLTNLSSSTAQCE